jgi:hypothetical protein
MPRGVSMVEARLLVWRAFFFGAFETQAFQPVFLTLFLLFNFYCPAFFIRAVSMA